MSGQFENEPPSQSKGIYPSGIVTAFFTDIVNSTVLYGRMPGATAARREAVYREKIKKPLDEIVVKLIAGHGGEVVNSTGDGSCIVFPDAQEAVLCAIEIQEQMTARAIPTPLGPLQIRVGMHTGSALPTCREDGVIPTLTMNKAARVISHACGGQVLVSKETYALSVGELRTVGFDSAGAFELKGIGREELFVAFREGQNPFEDAEDRYRQHIIQRFGKLTLYSISSDKPLAVDLEQVFVNLTASERRVPEAWPSLKDLQESESSDDDPYDELENDKQLPRSAVIGIVRPAQETTILLTLNEALREHSALTILGAPGSGKTTLLKYLALSFARGQAEERLELEEDRLPLYLPLRDLNKWLDAKDKQHGLSQPAPRFLADFLQESYAHLFPTLNLPANFFALALSKRKCVVLLDGLDEVADSLQRVGVAEFAAACLGHYAGNRFVLTSRPRGYEIACRLHLAARCGECSIRDFNDAQIKSFAQSWYLAVTVDLEGDNPTARDHAAQRAEDLLRAVETPRVRPFATNPLLLSILALIHQRGNRLPQQRVALYEECIEFFLGFWHQVKGGTAALELADIGNLSRTEKRALLEPVALWMHERGAQGTEVSRGELEKQLAGQFADLYTCNRGDALRRAREFVEIIIQHTGLLVERESGVFAFAHLTFQEFLCARALADTPDYWQTLRPHLHEPWWREVVLLLAGHLSSPGTRRAREDTAQLLHQIHNAGSWLEDVLHRDLLLAFRCSCDMEQLGLDPSWRKQLVGEVLQLWKQSKIEPLRDEIVELFPYAAPTPTGELIRDWMLSMIQDGNHGVRSSAAYALGRLGAAAATPEVLRRLVALSQDGNDGVRSSAAYALGRLGAAAATPEVLLRLVALSQDGNDGVRSSAAYALGLLGAAAATPEVLQRLVALSQDGNDGVRSSAASALGRLGAAAATPEVLRRLVALSQDGNDGVRSSAAYALGRLGAAAATPEVLRRLVALSQDGNDGVRSSAAYALGRLGAAAATPEVLLRLVALSQDGNDGVRSSAADALGRLGAAAATPTPEALQRLVALSQDGNDGVRSSAASALGRLGAAAATPEVLARMIFMLKEATVSVGANLAWSCGQAGDKLNAEHLAVLAKLWRKHLNSSEEDVFCGEYQQLSSAAYKQLKHLASFKKANSSPASPLRKRKMKNS